MVRVVLSSSMAELAEGMREVELAVGNYRELTLALCEQWPQMAGLIERSAVAIDGQIYQDAFAEALASGSEVFFMPRIEGG